MAGKGADHQAMPISNSLGLLIEERERDMKPQHWRKEKSIVKVKHFSTPSIVHSP
jgi:hypothetical protein